MALVMMLITMPFATLMEMIVVVQTCKGSIAMIANVSVSTDTVFENDYHMITK